MNLTTELSQAKELGEWLHSNTNEIGFEYLSEKEEMSFSLFQHSIDIDDGIVLLLENNLPGPALALARPRFEAYVRGLWLLIGASDDSIEDTKNGNWPKFSTLINQIGSNPETGGAWIKANADVNLKDFHDLTHGGVSHITRRRTGSSIEPNYPVEELKALVVFGLEIKIRIGTELLARANLADANEELHHKATSIRNTL